MEAAVQETTAVGTAFAARRVARVQNVVARVAGRDPGPAVLLVAHYDSVPVSPGAADNAAGVAALLETARALRAAPPLRNDVLFLFSDAEELGLLGARGFASGHAWMPRAGLVLNFEARGHRGPAYMFETGPGTGPLMRHFAAAAPHPVAASYFTEIYRRLPNDTDFTVFRDAGLPGFNFAFIDGTTVYHSAEDRADRLSAASLQHHGSYALGLARHFAEEGTSAPAGPAATVYFNLPFAGLVVVSAFWMRVAGLVAVLGGAAVVARGIAIGRPGVAALLGSTAVALVAVLTAAVIAWIGHRVFFAAVDLGTDEIEGGRLVAGLSLLAAAAVAALQLLAVRRLGRVAVAAGALVIWLALTLLVLVELPGAGHLATAALLGGVPALALVAARRPASPASEALLLGLGAAPIVLLWAPLTVTVSRALGAGGALLVAAVAALVLLLLTPQLTALGRAGRWAPAAFLLASAACLAAAATEAPPRTDTLFYLLDAGAGPSGSGEAIWGSFDSESDSWTARFLGDRPTRRPLEDVFAFGVSPILSTPAPAIPLAPPQLVSASPPAPDEELRVRDGAFAFRVRSPRPGACRLRLALAAEAEMRALAVDGRAITLESGERQVELTLYGDLGEGFEVTGELAADGPLRITAVDRSYGLPPVPGYPIDEPRPAGLLPSRHGATDFSSVRQVFVLPAGAPSAGR
jgi:hypothetical protein